MEAGLTNCEHNLESINPDMGNAKKGIAMATVNNEQHCYFNRVNLEMLMCDIHNDAGAEDEIKHITYVYL